VLAGNIGYSIPFSARTLLSFVYEYCSDIPDRQLLHPTYFFNFQ